jgi:hypothetical protein
MLATIGAILASLSISFFIIWLLGLMAAVLAACLIVCAARKIISVYQYWRFLLWLNQSPR